MGGRAAEELLFHEVTGGASNDFEKANQIATTMVTKWGMGRDPEAKEDGTSGRGSLSFLVAPPERLAAVRGPGRRDARDPRDPRRGLRRGAAPRSSTTWPTLRRIAAYLVEHERVDGDTFDALFDGSHDVPNAESEWRPARRATARVGGHRAVPRPAHARAPAAGHRFRPSPAAGRRRSPRPPLPAARGRLRRPCLLCRRPAIPAGAGRRRPAADRPASQPRRGRSRGGLLGPFRGGRRPAPAAAVASIGTHRARLRAWAAGQLRAAEARLLGSEAEPEP